jgi:hypothetical protein
MVDYSMWNPQAYTPVDGGALVRPTGLDYPDYAQRLNTPALQIPALTQPLELRQPLASNPPQRAPDGYRRSARTPQPVQVNYGRYYSQASAPTAAEGAFGVNAGGISDKRSGGSAAYNFTPPDAAAAMGVITATITAGRSPLPTIYGGR